MPKRLLLLLLLAVACTSATPPPPLPEAAPSKAFRPAKLQEIDAAVTEAIARKRIPGGVLWIEREGETWQKVWGNRSLDPKVEPMTADTIFDAASLTKVVATAPSVWILIDDGRLALDGSAKSWLPELADGRITIRHLLTHTSGLRPSLDLHDPWEGYDEGVRRALAETPRHTPGIVFRYSDINFILLGEIVRRVSGMPVDEFARRNIFQPLGMRDTRFRPPAGPRIAPTERTSDGMLRGVVHDPTARRMGGVAGHAGLFTTAEDLARFSRAVLAGRFPKAMTEVASPAAVAVKRAGGFDLDSAYSRPRGDLFPLGSFGHTGWTGGFFWIDPSSRAFYVFLSNRVHPDGSGSVTALQHRLGTLVASSLTGTGFRPSPRRSGWVLGGGDVLNGIDVLEATGYAPLLGKKIGLITNQSGLDRAGNPTIDLLRSVSGITLVSLFSPEHGIRGTDDDRVADSVDGITGLPVYSLYGERRKPSPEQLRGLDALVYDVQDIGTRFYTYISTMGLAMEAAAEAGIEFVVLDRVNPIGGEVVEGPVLEGEPSFTGWHPLPIRHGMTVGELARMFREERGIRVDLAVVEIRGWTREQWQDQAGLPWVSPSPNMRSLNAAALYPGIGLLETAISVGRGTPYPFELLGAPWIDGSLLARELDGIPGLAFAPLRFVPRASIHAGEDCGGVQISIIDRRRLRPVAAGITIAATLARLYPEHFPVDEVQRLLRHTPTLEAIRSGRAVAPDTGEFLQRRAKYLLY